MNHRPWSAFVRIVVLVASVVVLTSRTTLLIHEFVGHGAAAMLFGGRITGWYLFLFAGGRVSYDVEVLNPGPRLVITLGGIALEIVIGFAALVLARRIATRTVAAFCFLCVGTVLVGHGAVYLARGVHYGYGDGAYVARLLGERRAPLVLLATALAVGTGVYAGRRLVELPSAAIGGSARRAAAMALLAFVCAALVHGALAWSEIRWFPDPRWVAIMENASVVSARAELARRVEQARRQGETVPTPEEQTRTLDALERERRPWPLDPALATGMFAGLVVGVARGAREKRGPSKIDVPWRTIGSIAGALAVMVVVIHVIRRNAPS